MTPHLDCLRPGNPDTSRRPVLSGLAWLVFCLLACTAGVSFADEGEAVRLDLGQPYLRGNNVWLDFTLSGLISGEVLDALHSGLPVTIVFEWWIWQRRDGWWDRHVDSGAMFFRVFYDVLQSRYDVFDHRGRLIASSDNPREIEPSVSDSPGLKLVSAGVLHADRRYFVEVLARIEMLDEEEVRNLEDWLSGPDRNDGGLNLVRAMSERLARMLGGIVGPREKAVEDRTEDFSGF